MKNIAIIGATGNVGRKLIELFIQRKTIDPKQLTLFASKKSEGTTVDILGNAFLVRDVKYCDFENYLLAIFTTESDVSKQYIPIALQAGIKVIDASSAYRLDPSVPLIVPPINGHLITPHHHLFSHANCLASPISVVLKPLHDYAIATRANVSTYQSTSGAGKGAMDELYQQTQNVYEKKPISHQHFQRPIPFNVIPQVSEFLDDGFSYEEFKIMKEIQKIVSPDINIAATSVRVPVMIGHGMSLSIEFQKPINIETVKTILSSSVGVQLSQNHYTTPTETEGKDDVFVGRIRKDPTVPSGILLWLVSDNLRRGAALDEVEMAEIILRGI